MSISMPRKPEWESIIKPLFSHLALSSFRRPSLNSSVCCSYWEHLNEGANAACLKRIRIEIKEQNVLLWRHPSVSSLSHCRQRNKSLLTMNRVLFQVSITETCKSTVMNVPKILIQSATINDYLWGFQRILSIYFRELLTLRDSHHYLNFTAVLVYTHATKKTFCSTFSCCFTTCNGNKIWIQQLFWALYAFHQIAVSRNTFPSDLQNSDICVIKIYSEFNMHISTDAIWEYIIQRRTQNTYVGDD